MIASAAARRSREAVEPGERLVAIGLAGSGARRLVNAIVTATRARDALVAEGRADARIRSVPGSAYAAQVGGTRLCNWTNDSSAFVAPSEMSRRAIICGGSRGGCAWGRPGCRLRN